MAIEMAGVPFEVVSMPRDADFVNPAAPATVDYGFKGPLKEHKVVGLPKDIASSLDGWFRGVLEAVDSRMNVATEEAGAYALAQSLLTQKLLERVGRWLNPGATTGAGRMIEVLGFLKGAMSLRSNEIPAGWGKLDQPRLIGSVHAAVDAMTNSFAVNAAAATLPVGSLERVLAEKAEAVETRIAVSGGAVLPHRKAEGRKIGRILAGIMGVTLYDRARETGKLEGEERYATFNPLKELGIMVVVDTGKDEGGTGWKYSEFMKRAYEFAPIPLIDPKTSQSMMDRKWVKEGSVEVRDAYEALAILSTAAYAKPDWMDYTKSAADRALYLNVFKQLTKNHLIAMEKVKGFKEVLNEYLRAYLGHREIIAPDGTPRGKNLGRIRDAHDAQHLDPIREEMRRRAEAAGADYETSVLAERLAYTFVYDANTVERWNTRGKLPALSLANPAYVWRTVVFNQPGDFQVDDDPSPAHNATRGAFIIPAAPVENEKVGVHDTANAWSGRVESTAVFGYMNPLARAIGKLMGKTGDPAFGATGPWVRKQLARVGGWTAAPQGVKDFLMAEVKEVFPEHLGEDAFTSLKVKDMAGNEKTLMEVCLFGVAGWNINWDSLSVEPFADYSIRQGYVGGVYDVLNPTPDNNKFYMELTTLHTKEENLRDVGERVGLVIREKLNKAKMVDDRVLAAMMIRAMFMKPYALDTFPDVEDVGHARLTQLAKISLNRISVGSIMVGVKRGLGFDVEL